MQTLDFKVPCPLSLMLAASLRVQNHKVGRFQLRKDGTLEPELRRRGPRDSIG